MKESSKPTHNTIGHRQTEWVFNLLLMANGLLSAKQLDKMYLPQQVFEIFNPVRLFKVSIQFNAQF